MTPPAPVPPPNESAVEALAELLAKAWDEGWERAEYMARCWGHTDNWCEEDPYPTNPYRNEAAR